MSKTATEELQLRKKIDGKNNEERKNERQAAWKKKVLHGQFLRETEGMQDQRKWQLLKAGELKRETESLRKNAVKNGINSRTCPLYAGSARRKLKALPMLSVRVQS